MHVHVWRRISVHGPYAGNRFGVVGIAEERCRCGMKQSRRVRVRRMRERP